MYSGTSGKATGRSLGASGTPCWVLGFTSSLVLVTDRMDDSDWFYQAF
jgi:hypothetical protein